MHKIRCSKNAGLPIGYINKLTADINVLVLTPDATGSIVNGMSRRTRMAYDQLFQEDTIDEYEYKAEVMDRIFLAPVFATVRLVQKVKTARRKRRERREHP